MIAYLVRVVVEGEPEGIAIRDGMTASARITTGAIEDVVLIPNWAIRTDQDTGSILAYCYCLDSGSPQRVEIELGAGNETWTQVLSGIDEGATVALVTEETNFFDMDRPGPGARMGRQ